VVVIRPALEEEYEAVGALSVAGYDADGYLTYPDGTFDDGYAGWLADAASRAGKSTLLVAIDDDELVGTVTWCPYGSGDAQLAKEPHQGEFRTLSIAPEARGRGIGRALVERCLELAREAGLTEVLLFSLLEMVPAHRLYARLGFVRRPELDWSPEPDVHLWAFSLSM
jgi:ribosomal protein S18 acetylase RimI-like enzyme